MPDQPPTNADGTGPYEGTPSPVASEVRAGTVVAGKYKLLEPIGEGGMGTVWMAEQREPVKRLVAVKLIKAGMDSKAVLARFEAERQALALMDHPNVARVLDAGATESGRPYFVMELVHGVPITEFCDKNKLPTRDRLLLFADVCRAVQHAHQKGIIHRDLKPSNILLRPSEDKKFTLWISDFGWSQIQSVRSLEMARVGPRGEQQRLAQRGAASALYASPQQTKKEPPAPTDDVHALGVIWYQLLKRDPSAAAPVGTEWVEDLRANGFTDSQARLLQACVSTRPDKRPKNAMALAENLAAVTIAAVDTTGTDGSKLISLRCVLPPPSV
jgi:serine/threonine protein kinase